MKHYHLTRLARFLIGLISVLSLIWLGLWFYLSDYQTQLPSNSGTLVVNAIKTADVDWLEETSSNFPKLMTNPSAFRAYLATFGENPDVFSYPVTCTNPSQLCYAVAINATKVATLTLSSTNQRSFFGFQKYRLDELRFTNRPQTIITAPASATLLINGFPAEEVAEVTQAEHPVFNATRYPQVGIKTYTLSGFHFVNELSVKDVSTADIEWNLTKTSAEVYLPGDAALQADLEAYVLEVAQAYSIFISHRQISKQSVLKYTYEGSRLYQNISEYIKWYMFIFNEQTFTNVTFEPLVQYGPEAYSLRVSYQMDFTTVEGYPKHYDVSYDIYVTRLDGQWVTVDILF